MFRLVDDDAPPNFSKSGGVVGGEGAAGGARGSSQQEKDSSRSLFLSVRSSGPELPKLLSVIAQANALPVLNAELAQRGVSITGSSETQIVLRIDCKALNDESIQWYLLVLLECCS